MLTARLADAEVEKLADSLSAESRPIRLHAFGPCSAALPLPPSPFLPSFLPTVPVPSTSTLTFPPFLLSAHTPSVCTLYLASVRSLYVTPRPRMYTFPSHRIDMAAALDRLCPPKPKGLRLRQGLPQYFTRSFRAFAEDRKHVSWRSGGLFVRQFCTPCHGGLALRGSP